MAMFMFTKENSSEIIDLLLVHREDSDKNPFRVGIVALGEGEEIDLSFMDLVEVRKARLCRNGDTIVYCINAAKRRVELIVPAKDRQITPAEFILEEDDDVIELPEWLGVNNK